MMSRPLRWLALAGSAALVGCVGYYPDPQPGYGSTYYADGAPVQGGPVYGGDGYAGGGYYAQPYYGPAYGGTTVYFDTYSPGYYYRPGYGYYAPPPGRPRGGDPHGGWGDKAYGAVGANPPRYPQGGPPQGGRPPYGGQPQPTGASGWRGQIPNGSNGAPRPPQAAPAQQQPRGNDEHYNHRGWSDHAQNRPY